MLSSKMFETTTTALEAHSKQAATTFPMAIKMVIKKNDSPIRLGLLARRAQQGRIVPEQHRLTIDVDKANARNGRWVYRKANDPLEGDRKEEIKQGSWCWLAAKTRNPRKYRDKSLTNGAGGSTGGHRRLVNHIDGWSDRYALFRKLHPWHQRAGGFTWKTIIVVALVAQTCMIGKANARVVGAADDVPPIGMSLSHRPRPHFTDDTLGNQYAMTVQSNSPSSLHESNHTRKIDGEGSIGRGMGGWSHSSVDIPSSPSCTTSHGRRSSTAEHAAVMKTTQTKRVVGIVEQCVEVMANPNDASQHLDSIGPQTPINYTIQAPKSIGELSDSQQSTELQPDVKYKNGALTLGVTRENKSAESTASCLMVSPRPTSENAKDFMKNEPSHETYPRDIPHGNGLQASSARARQIALAVRQQPKPEAAWPDIYMHTLHLVGSVLFSTVRARNRQNRRIKCHTVASFDQIVKTIIVNVLLRATFVSGLTTNESDPHYPERHDPVAIPALIKGTANNLTYAHMTELRATMNDATTMVCASNVRPEVYRLTHKLNCQMLLTPRRGVKAPEHQILTLYEFNIKRHVTMATRCSRRRYVAGFTSGPFSIGRTREKVVTSWVPVGARECERIIDTTFSQDDGQLTFLVKNTYSTRHAPEENWPGFATWNVVSHSEAYNTFRTTSIKVETVIRNGKITIRSREGEMDHCSYLDGQCQLKNNRGLLMWTPTHDASCPYALWHKKVPGVVLSNIFLGSGRFSGIALNLTAEGQKRIRPCHGTVQSLREAPEGIIWALHDTPDQFTASTTPSNSSNVTTSMRQRRAATAGVYISDEEIAAQQEEEAGNVENKQPHGESPVMKSMLNMEVLRVRHDGQTATQGLALKVAAVLCSSMNREIADRRAQMNQDATLATRAILQNPFLVARSSGQLVLVRRCRAIGLNNTRFHYMPIDNCTNEIPVSVKIAEKWTRLWLNSKTLEISGIYTRKPCALVGTIPVHFGSQAGVYDYITGRLTLHPLDQYERFPSFTDELTDVVNFHGGSLPPTYLNMHSVSDVGGSFTDDGWHADRVDPDFDMENLQFVDGTLRAASSSSDQSAKTAFDEIFADDDESISGKISQLISGALAVGGALAAVFCMCGMIKCAQSLCVASTRLAVGFAVPLPLRVILYCISVLVDTARWAWKTCTTCGPATSTEPVADGRQQRRGGHISPTSYNRIGVGQPGRSMIRYPTPEPNTIRVLSTKNGVTTSTLEPVGGTPKSSTIKVLSTKNGVITSTRTPVDMGENSSTTDVGERLDLYQRFMESYDLEAMELQSLPKSRGGSNAGSDDNNSVCSGTQTSEHRVQRNKSTGTVSRVASDARLTRPTTLSLSTPPMPLFANRPHAITEPAVINAAGDPHKRQIFAKVELDGTETTVLCDTGADASVCSAKLFESLKLKNPALYLRQDGRGLQNLSGESVNVLGMVYLPVQMCGTTRREKFIIVDKLASAPAYIGNPFLSGWDKFIFNWRRRVFQTDTGETPMVMNDKETLQTHSEQIDADLEESDDFVAVFTNEAATIGPYGECPMEMQLNYARRPELQQRDTFFQMDSGVYDDLNLHIESNLVRAGANCPTMLVCNMLPIPVNLPANYLVGRAYLVLAAVPHAGFSNEGLQRIAGGDDAIINLARAAQTWCAPKPVVSAAILNLSDRIDALLDSKNREHQAGVTDASETTDRAASWQRKDAPTVRSRSPPEIDSSKPIAPPPRPYMRDLPMNVKLNIAPDQPEVPDRVLSAAEKAAREAILQQVPEHVRAVVIGTEVSLDMFQRIIDIFKECPEVASTDRYDIGKTSLLTVDLPVKSDVPCVSRPHYQSPDQRAFMENEINNLVEKGIMIRWSSPWSSPAFVVRSASGKQRLVIDYRKLNKQLVTAAPQTPSPTHIFADMQPKKYYAVLDLVQSFYHISVTPQATDRLAGIQVAPTALQSLTRWCLADVHEEDSVLAAFVDDVIIGSSTMETLVRTAGKVLRNYVRAGLKINVAKSKIGVTKVTYLGFMISPRGFQITEDRVDVIRRFKTPINVKGVRSQLGYFNYLRSFIARFSEIAAPLIRLLKKDVVFHIGPDELRALETLKRAVVEGQILEMPREPGQSELVVATDASTICLGGSVAQTLRPGVEVTANTKVRPIAYVSRTLNAVDQLKPIWFLELAACIFTIKKCHAYLGYRRFFVFCDSTTVISILRADTKDLPAQVARMKMTLEAYSFTVIYRSTALNVDCDAISRNPVYDAPDMTIEEELLGEKVNFHEITPTRRTLPLPMERQPIGSLRTQPTDEQILKKLEENVLAERENLEKGEECKSEEKPVTINRAMTRARKMKMNEAKKSARSSSPTTSPRTSPTTSPTTSPRTSPTTSTSPTRPTPTEQEDQRISNLQDDLLSDDDKQADGQRLFEQCIDALTVPKLVDAQGEDSDLADIYRFLQHKELPPKIGRARRVAKRSEQFHIDNKTGLLYYKTGNDVKPRLCVPSKYTQQLLNRYHGRSDLGCHGMVDAMLSFLRPNWYWKSLISDVSKFTRACMTCAKARKLRPNRVLPLNSTTPPSYVGHTLQVDLLELPISTSKHRYVLVMVDTCSRYLRCTPLRTKETSAVSKKIVEDWFLPFGPPAVLSSDSGGEFVSAIQKGVCALFAIRQRHGTPYHSMTQSTVERSNTRILNALRCFVKPSGRDWPAYLPYCTHALNLQVSASTQDSPFRLMFGRSARMITNSALDTVYDDQLEFRSDYVSKLQRSLTESYRFAVGHTMDARDRQKLSHDQHAKAKAYKVGDLVLRKMTARPLGESNKLSPLYSGPWRVLAVRNNVVDIQWEGAARSGGHAERRRTNVALLRDYAFTPSMPPPQEDRQKSDWPMSNIRQGGRTLPALHRDAPAEASSDNDSWAYNHVWRDYKDMRGKDYVLSERHGGRINGTVQPPPSRSPTPPNTGKNSESDSSDDSPPDFQRRPPHAERRPNRPTTTKSQPDRHSASERRSSRRQTGRQGGTRQQRPPPAPSPPAPSHHGSNQRNSLSSESTQWSGYSSNESEPAPPEPQNHQDIEPSDGEADESHYDLANETFGSTAPASSNQPGPSGSTVRRQTSPPVNADVATSSRQSSERTHAVPPVATRRSNSWEWPDPTSESDSSATAVESPDKPVDIARSPEPTGPAEPDEPKPTTNGGHAHYEESTEDSESSVPDRPANSPDTIDPNAVHDDRAQGFDGSGFHPEGTFAISEDDEERFHTPKTENRRVRFEPPRAPARRPNTLQPYRSPPPPRHTLFTSTARPQSSTQVDNAPTTSTHRSPTPTRNTHSTTTATADRAGAPSSTSPSTPGGLAPPVLRRSARLRNTDKIDYKAIHEGKRQPPKK